MKKICCVLLICVLLSGCDGIVANDQDTDVPSENTLISGSPTIIPGPINNPSEESTAPELNPDSNNISTYMWDVYNPIDEYFEKIFQLPLIEAARNDYAEYYGNAWQAEYENIVSWIKSQMVYQEDRNNLADFDKNVDKSSELVWELIKVSDFSISPDNSDEPRNKLNIVYDVGITRVTIYRSAFCLLYNLFPNYEFLDQEYISPEYLPEGFN